MSKHSLSARKIIKAATKPVAHPVSFSKDATHRLVESVRTVRTTHRHLQDYNREVLAIKSRSEAATERFFDDNFVYFAVFADALANAEDTDVKDSGVWLRSNRLRLKQLFIDLISLQVAKKYRDALMWDGEHYYAAKLQKEVDKLEEPTEKAVETFRRHNYPIDDFLKQQLIE